MIKEKTASNNEKNSEQRFSSKWKLPTILIAIATILTACNSNKLTMEKWDKPNELNIEYKQLKPESLKINNIDAKRDGTYVDYKDNKIYGIDTVDLNKENPQ